MSRVYIGNAKGTKLPIPSQVLAASYRRLAAVFKVRAVNYRSKAKTKLGNFDLLMRAKVCDDLAEELTHEARLLRAKK